MTRIILTKTQQETARRLGMSNVEYAHGIVEAVREGHIPAEILTNPKLYELKGRLMKSINAMSLPQLIAFEVKVKKAKAKKRNAELRELLRELFR